MSTLSLLQRRFSYQQAIFVLMAYSRGYEMTKGDAYRSPKVFGEIGESKGYGHPRSCHKLRLAQDWYVWKDGVFLQGEKAEAAHNELHDIWDTMGGAKRIPHDLNHYSFEYQGHR